ncbi:5'-methylthioadenosine phosphorylase [Candidatus Syntrophocurvum alkaliphilum]|uniref:Probable 6-oxopurine nucleoside phosphorylase n=1 Tax=Candidatus Syntrophocurvum alkaliphilum TaxID=2293317 RepID=A0A6I6D7U2_9FIRM|nr:S-methyl-5'-thioadenosine phosphorylase [Candidatus Syntrophocurvum alkaliphilum]QGT99093.1 5'-methylthioadenosine phosphorylase [Candidatus Syntrophocurvum alkaliphilum]
MPKIAIIGGTGIYNPKLLDNVKEVEQKTKYGDVKVLIGDYKGIEIAFIPRHGSKHSVPPHLINYRANIMALHHLGVKNILATAAVGSLNYEFKPGQFVLADQFIDFTKSRQNTFFEGGDEGVIHCDMTVPYCPDLRKAIKQAAHNKNIDIQDNGVYVCTEGPRFETAAEIQMFKMMGGHLIGMTSVPEVCLSRELGMCYANISIITNFAAGISTQALTHAEVVDMMRSRVADVRQLVMETLLYVFNDKNCDCTKILDEIGVNK